MTDLIHEPLQALVTGIGWVSASGMGCGRGGVPFTLGPGCLPKLARRDVFEEPYKRFGRLDDYSKLGLSAITFALRDAGLEHWESKRPIGVIASSRWGCLRTDMAYFDTVLPDSGRLASPNLFAYTLSNCFLGEAAIRFGLTGAGFVLNEGGAGGMDTLGMALGNLAMEDCEAMLVGISDLEPPVELALQDPEAGAVFLVLERQQREGVQPYGRICLKKGRIHWGEYSCDCLTELAAALLPT